MADEATIRKLESLLREREKEILENNRIRMKHDEEIQALREAIDD